MPIFEIPHPFEAPTEVVALLSRRYATVVRLPFRDANARAKVRAMISSLDTRFLLLSQNVLTLRLVVDQEETETKISRVRKTHDFEVITLSIEGGSSHPTKRLWMKWCDNWEHGEKDKRLSVAICLPANDAQEIQSIDEHDAPALFSFFPTEETLDVGAVIHASFDLTQNRKYFRENERNEGIFPRLTQLLQRIVAEVPAHVALQAFGRIDPTKSNGISKTVATNLLSVILETAFIPTIGGNKARPSEVTLWSGKFGTVLSSAPELRSYKLLDPAVANCDQILQRLGATKIGLSHFFYALQHCKNSTFAQCENVIGVVFNEGLPLLESAAEYERESLLPLVPCWWTDEGIAFELGSRRAIDHKAPPPSARRLNNKGAGLCVPRQVFTLSDGFCFG